MAVRPSPHRDYRQSISAVYLCFDNTTKPPIEKCTGNVLERARESSVLPTLKTHQLKDMRKAEQI